MSSTCIDGHLINRHAMSKFTDLTLSHCRLSQRDKTEIETQVRSLLLEQLIRPCLLPCVMAGDNGEEKWSRSHGNVNRLPKIKFDPCSAALDCRLPGLDIFYRLGRRIYNDCIIYTHQTLVIQSYIQYTQIMRVSQM